MQNRKLEKRRKHPLTPQRRLELYALPHIGKKQLADITSSHMREIVYELRDEKPAVALNLRALLKSLFEYSVELELIDHNPVARVSAKYLTHGKPRTRSLPLSEI